MLKHSKSGFLKVALLAISPHNRAILEFFFSGAGRNLFKVVQAAEADAFILDYDHPDARDDWAKHANQHKPGIILSVHQANLANCVWIPKPLTSRALADAVGQVNELLDKQEPPTPTAYRPPITPTQAAPTPEKTLVKHAEQHVQDLPQPFGMPTRPERKLRSLVISLPEDDEEDMEAVPPPSNVVHASVAEAAPATEAVFDPAETDIPLEEVDRPVETTLSQEAAEQRWKTLCGEQEDSHTATEIILFTPENYLLATLLDGMRLSRDSQQTVQVRFSARDHALLMPQQGLAYCTLDTRSDEFTTLCSNPVQTGQITLHIPSSTELEQLEQQAGEDADALLDLEAFVWVSSLLTARGRLGRGVEIERKISLKHWPNLTRLEQFPHIMRIAALWHQRPASPLEIATALGVPQRYVFSFHTAANALNLFEMDQSKFKSREKEKPKENRGFFSRLLKRLLGGGAK
ncbi:hypothetical protein [Thiothrix nivea]|uniref:Uncharacterized protein n=1 Tax=Thiothrix nivea (strain ATCC 35100 / DSM 5205 / JP2) TaxID=870187 RepID=A0A656HIV3_THINJ|nr:hypothetical protein [Thiothrix nivea]EIJ34925.1 hypothetical protein Thini_2371 [Thiothrix nivea DSM 5205]